LRPVPAGQSALVEREPLADQPDVELHILTPPPSARSGPHVAAVAFPAHWSVADAKRLIYRELEECCLQPAGRCLHWSEDDSAIELVLGRLAGPTLDVPLDEGITERVEVHSGRTGAVRFACAAGWTRPRVETWLAERLQLRDRGRTALLSTVYRSRPVLAHFVSDLFFGGSCRPAEDTPAASRGLPPVEFVPVPALGAPRDGPRPRTGSSSGPAFVPAGHGGPGAVAVKAPRLRALRGGAGLEMDLADSRPVEHLPAELRALLPRHGLVNYLEACAVVTALESLLADAAFAQAVASWQSSRAACCQTGSPCQPAAGSPAHGPAIAVIALYPAQVELLRLLLRRSPAVAGCTWPIEVGLPAAFRQRECLAALVSLTRSHTHRAVSYGEGPHSLAEACTRAAERLLLFGDPATLARRVQWQGALDHLDEPSAQAERSLVARLVACLQGQGSHERAFCLREGGGV
jgi:hypothetical protein